MRAHPPSVSSHALRAWQVLRHIPPRQFARRVILLARMRLDRLRVPSARIHPAPPLAASLPRPLFAPMTGRMTCSNATFRFCLPWGERELSRPIEWHPAAATPLEKSWRTRLHYMDYLDRIDDDVLIELIEGWIASCAVPDWRYAWRPYNLSVRTAAWLMELCRRRERLPPTFVDTATASLAAQTRFLAARLETDIHGNHLIKNLKALLWAGTCLDVPEATGWRAKSRSLLAAELIEQILADGCHYERSPSYHCQVLADLINCRTLLDNPSDPLRRELDTSIARMVEVALALSHPDGGPALLNDSGLDMAPSAAACAAAWAELAGTPLAEAQNGPFALPEAGYWGLRRGGTYLVLDCGPLGPGYLVGHGHGDLLSFEWSTGGRRIVVDQGAFQYAAGPDRVLSRSTLSHNTVSIDEVDPFDFFGGLRCGRRAKPLPLAQRLDPGKLTFEGSHDGFDHLPGAPRHIRRLEAEEHLLSIHDRVLDGAGQGGTARLLLHPSCRVEVGEHAAAIYHGEVVVRLEADQRILAESAEWYPNMYVRRPTTRLRLEVPPGEEGLTIRLARRWP